MILRHQPENLASLADHDLGIKGKSACQFGAELRPGNWPPDHESARRADVDGTEVLQLLGERGRSKGPVTADVDSSQKNQSGAGLTDSGMGGGVQPARRQGQCCRAWPDSYAARGVGTLRLARCHHGHEARGRPCGDRRGRGIPGLAPRQLYDRSDRGGRRRPNRDLAVSGSAAASPVSPSPRLIGSPRQYSRSRNPASRSHSEGKDTHANRFELMAV
jgi:hypothetical protein